MLTGECRLCRQTRELERSHIWPRFAYKRYVSDLSDGGSFLDLNAGAKSNRQYTDYWFCGDCEDLLSRPESWAARFCDDIESSPASTRSYNDRLLDFCVGVSMRTLMYAIEMSEQSVPSMAHAAVRRWRRFLLGRSRTVAGFTQHLFIVHNEEFVRHLALGGQPFWDQRFMRSQIGPLHILGLLDRTGLSANERTIWAQSEVRAAGGQITPVTEWRVGENVTETVFRTLDAHEQRLTHRVIETSQSIQRRGTCLNNTFCLSRPMIASPPGGQTIAFSLINRSIIWSMLPDLMALRVSRS